MSDDAFHRKLVADLATATLREQRARRRWRTFFTFLFFAYLVAVTALFYRGDEGIGIGAMGGVGEPYAAVIQISGTIEAGGMNASSRINGLLKDAFADKNSKGVILEINSPGGSAVESHRIYNEIRRLREKHPDKPIVAVAGDFCTSGGYFIAAAADDIYADPASLIGSIGVIFSSFGFTGTMEKLGVERRVQTAGGNKNLLDPFSPEEAEGIAAIEDILDDIHAVFLKAVKDGRGERLAADVRIFDGTIFSGSDSLELGLIDGFDDIGGVARDVMGVEKMLYYRQQDWLDSILGKFGAFASGGVLARAPL